MRRLGREQERMLPIYHAKSQGLYPPTKNREKLAGVNMKIHGDAYLMLFFGLILLGASIATMLERANQQVNVELCPLCGK